MKCKQWGWIVGMLLLLTTQGLAQDRIERFAQFKATLALEEELRSERIDRYGQQYPNEKTINLGNGEKGYLYDVINGKPVYMAVDNSEAATNMGAASMWRGGRLGIDLTGAGLRLYVWDGPGGARATHQEFGGRITLGSDFEGGGASNHGTHVTGSVLSGGVEDPNARGMAYEANGVVFDFNNDLTEMTQELANNRETMILSNHSYGPPAGWQFVDNEWEWFGDENISTREDWKFGFYNSQARNYDELVYDAPYYLIVKSAGNHRSDVGDGVEGSAPADGPYDAIPFFGIAKNIVTVGAVGKLNTEDGRYTGPEDVNVTSFSSFGPADDGRIKPDIAAPGLQVYSTWANADDSYANLQGTSMSTPLVMGTLALIQDLNKLINGGFLTAAQLKGLMIHHAHEAGVADGPDYIHGWGLINGDGMANFLLQENNENIDLIADEIADGETKTYTIEAEPGTQVKLTLVWTDVPGSPTDPQLDPEQLMLVNDLDMRAVGDSETHMPWTLDPAIPEQPARKGDNFRDNVEKIEFTATDAAYSLNITHKSSITEGPQKYALVVEYVKDDTPKTLYWVGNSGDWNNPANWSLNTGGEPANRVPTASDVVVFDDNSFEGIANTEQFTVSFSQSEEVAQFRWFATRQGAFEMGGNTLTTQGNLVVLSNQVSLNNGTFLLNGGGNKVINLESPAASSDVVVNGDGNTSFTIIGDFEANSLQLNNSAVDINGVNLKVGNLAVNESQVSVANSMLTLSGAFEIEGTTASVAWTNSDITIPEGGSATLDIGLTNLDANLTVAGGLTINGISTLKTLQNTGTVTLSGDMSLTDFDMRAGSTLNLADGATFSVSGDFALTGAEGMLANLNSAGTSEMMVEGYRKICGDFISINGVNRTGQAVISVGVNSQLAGSETGWQQIACDQLLFADFNFAFGCANGLTQFENLSTGPVASSAWNFGESDPAAVDSQEENPTYTFTSAGVKPIKLTIADEDNNSLTLTANTQIIENTIPSFNIDEQVGFLVSLVAGDAYQWYKDGVPIEGETTRQLQATDGGTYQVLVWDESCNRFSEDFVITVTSIEPDPEEQERVEEAVKVFPNPAREFIDVAVEGYNLRSLSLDLVDPSGKIVTTSGRENINANSHTERLKLETQRKGFYVLRIVVNDNIRINRKVIIGR